MSDDRDLLLEALARRLGYLRPTALAAPEAQPTGPEGSAPAFEHLPARMAAGHDVAPASLLDALVDETIRLSGGDARRALTSLAPEARAAPVGLGDGQRPRAAEVPAGFAGDPDGDGLAQTLRRPSAEEPQPSPARPSLVRDGTASQREDPLAFEDTHPSGKLRPALRTASPTPGRYTFDTGPHGGMEELGRGGVGRVVAARDRFVGRTVAMKELLRGHVSDPATDTEATSLLEERFAREARITGLIDHPAIVPVYELGRRPGGTLYYTMQRVQGRTLGSAFEASASLDERLELVRAFLTVCRGVAAAHEQGIIHRDLKPQNIMLGAFGATYVMDWGLARVLEKPSAPPGVVDAAPSLTGVHALGAVGTPAYMPPEQARAEHERVDERSDVWGLGAILFELLTGRPPFDGPSAWHVLAAVSRDPPPQVLFVEPEAPPELAAICQKALQREPADRYPSAGAMADDLEAWLAGQRVKAYRYDLSELTRRIGRRNRRAFAALGAGLAGLLIAFAVSVNRVQAERDDALDFARFALGEIVVEIAESQGSAELVGRLLDSSLELLRQDVALDTAPRQDLLRLGRVLVRLGELAVRRGAAAEAQKVSASARIVVRELKRRFPRSPEAASLALELDTVVAELPMIEGDILPTVAALRGLMDRANALRERGTSDVRALEAAARLYERLAAAEHNAGNATAGLTSEGVALGLLEQRAVLVTPDKGADAHARVRLAELLAHSAASKAMQGRDDEALVQGKRAGDTIESAVRRESTALTRLAAGTVKHTLGMVRLHAALGEGSSPERQSQLREEAKALARQALGEFDAVLQLEADHREARWRSVEAALVAGEFETAARLAAPLADTKGDEPLLALAAFGRGRIEEATRWASIPSGFYGTDRHFLRAVLAELAGDHDAAVAALAELARSPRTELVLLAPLVVQDWLKSAKTPSSARIRSWCEALLAAPSQEPFFSEATRELAATAGAETTAEREAEAKP